MPTKNTAARNTQADNLGDTYDRLEISSSDPTVLVTFTMAYDAAANGVAALSDPVEGTAVATGTAATARLYNSSGSEEITGLTVGLSDANVILDNLSIATDQVITLSTFTLTEPAATA